MRDAAETAAVLSHGRTRDDLDNDEMLRPALTKLVEIIGEAAKRVGRLRAPSSRTCHGPTWPGPGTVSCTTTSTST